MKDNEIPKIVELYTLAELYRGVDPVDHGVVNAFIEDVREYPVDTVRYAIEAARTDWYEVQFSPALVLEKIRWIKYLQYPDFNPARQWALVHKVMSDSCWLYVTIFNNIRTNLAIDLMGGQGYLKRHYEKKFEWQFRECFINNFHNATIKKNMSWEFFHVYHPLDHDNKLIQLVCDRQVHMLDVTAFEKAFNSAIQNQQELIIID